MARRRLGSRRKGSAQLTLGAVIALALIGGAVWMLREQGPKTIPGQIEAGGDDAIAAGGRVGGGAFDALGATIDRAQSAWDAAGKVEALERENESLRQWKELALALSERMERYEALLKMPPQELGQRADVAGAVSARLILDVGGPFKRTLLANAGSDHGVGAGFVAVNENGLVGRVVSIGRRSARVLLVDDYNSRVPVMGEQSRTRALLIGRAGDAPTLDLGPLTLQEPRLEFTVGAAGLRVGERVVTSGDGGIYPRGILVGWVAQGREGGWRVRLGAARQPIDYVRLIPSVAQEEPEANAFLHMGPTTPATASAAAGADATAAPAKPLPKVRRLSAPAPAAVGAPEEDQPSVAAAPAPAPAPSPAEDER